MTVPECPREERQLPEAGAEHKWVIRLLSVMLAVMSGIVASLLTYIVVASQQTTLLESMGAGAGAFLGVTTLTLTIEARLSPP